MIDKIRKIYQNNPDLIIKKINNSFTVIYFESISSSDKLNEFVTKPLIYENKISAPHTLKINVNECEKYLNNAFAVVIKNNKTLYAAEVRADLSRSIDNPESEPAVNGPKDALTENIQLNLGLIKRRIKSKDLIIKNETIGNYTNTLTEVLYIKNESNEEDVKIILEKQEAIGLFFEKTIKNRVLLQRIMKLEEEKLSALIASAEE